MIFYKDIETKMKNWQKNAIFQIEPITTEKITVPY